MKVFTFFYNRYNNATTSKALYENGIPHNVLIHTDEDKKKFEEGGTLYGVPVVTNAPKGLAYQRNHAMRMLAVGEWGVFLCDDFNRILSYPKKFITSSIERFPITFQNQQNFRLKAEHEITMKEMFSFFPHLINIAEKNGIHLIGFGLHDNPQNLKKKFTYRGLADGRFWLVKKSNYFFDEKAQLIDDVAWTAENIKRHGKVLVLNWTVPYFSRYTAGGFGTTKERIVQRKKECLYLVQKYHPLVQFAKKKNWEPGTHIRIISSKNNIIKAKQR